MRIGKQKEMEFSSYFDGFSKNYSFQEIIRRGSSSSSSSSLVLDGERGELVKAAMAGTGPKGVKAEKALEALRNHSEAERRRRERINGHLSTLRNLIPCKDKMDKASLLAEVVNHLKELRINAAEAANGILVPMDIDELRVEQEDGSDGASCSIRVSLCCDYKHEILSDLRQALDSLHLKTARAQIATLGSRMIYVSVIPCCIESNKTEESERCQLLATSIRHTLKSVLDKCYATEEILSRNTLSNKRRRIPFFDSSNSSSLGDLW
ncbi:hypothetical protein U1Q18_001697 [Sarracenia purpurea var. burkii]